MIRYLLLRSFISNNLTEFEFIASSLAADAQVICTVVDPVLEAISKKPKNRIIPNLFRNLQGIWLMLK
ncbi:MAG: hypothetical protein ABIO46_05060 [Chitinophagales bacterium]